MKNVIDTGLVCFKLPFDRGTEEICFNPNDTEFFSRIRRMFDRIGEIYKKAQEEYSKEGLKSVEQLEISENANNEIKKRKRRFNLFIRTKRYTQFGEKYENIFKQHKYECVQNQVVLTNTSAKIIREYTKSNRFTYITGFIPVK